MRITEHDNFDDLAPWQARWNELARGMPFRRWDWLEPWWRHYGLDAGEQTPNKRLLLLAVWDGDRLVSVAPWYTARDWADGRSIRVLGSGEACSEYLTILCDADYEDSAALNLAQWLTESSADDAANIEWDLLELTGVVAGDHAAGRLLYYLAEQGNSIHPRPGLNCWRIELPARWEDFVARLSKSHRKQVRRAARKLMCGEVQIRCASSQAELNQGLDILVELHQRRWTSLGERGCFGSPRFLQFHRDCAPRLFDAGCLDLVWLELNGRPLAVEYHLLSHDTAYAYQSGVDPERLDEEPGRLAVAATIGRHIEQCRRRYDFLRGDEPYKSHWRAVPQRIWKVQVVPRRTSARLRHGVMLATDSVKNWIRSGLELAGLR